MPYFVLILGTLRGLFFLFLGLPPLPNIFFAVTLINISIAILFSRLFSYLRNPGILNTYLKILIINIIFGLIWYFGDMTYGQYLFSSRNFLIFFILPFSVLFFLRAKENYLIVTIYIIAFIVSISCIIQFIICNIYPGVHFGTEIVRGPLEAITPANNSIVFARIGLLYRAHGITGHYHDSANILAMVSVFSLGNSFNKKTSIFSILLTLVFLLGLLSTLSLSNIIVAIFGIIMIIMFSYHGFYKKIFILVAVGYALTFIITFHLEPEKYEEVFNQLNPSGSKMTAMMNLGSSGTLERLISMILGHERSSRISDLGYIAESAIVVMLMEFGIITFIPFMMVLCFPVFLFFTNKNLRNEMWIPFITFITGLLTLLHYGSLFRSTSMFLFFAFYSMIIKKYLVGNVNTKNKIGLLN